MTLVSVTLTVAEPALRNDVTNPTLRLLKAFLQLCVIMSQSMRINFSTAWLQPFKLNERCR